jgi:hypothetical protein
LRSARTGGRRSGGLAAREIGVDDERLRHEPDSAFASTLAVVIGRPTRSTSPASGSSNPHAIEIVVVFPAPFGPSRPCVSPAATSKSTPVTTSILAAMICW